MRACISILLGLALALIIVVPSGATESPPIGTDSSSPTASPTGTPAASMIDAATPTPTATSIPTASLTPTSTPTAPSVTPTATGTPQATPTASPTSTAVPPARRLLDAATAASEAKGSAHVAEVTQQLTAGLERQRVTLAGSVSFRDGSFQVMVTTHDTRLDRRPARTTTSRSAVVLAGVVLAVRQDHQRWQCNAGSGTLPGGISLLQPGQTGGTATVAFSSPPQTTVTGVPVWDVVVSVRLPYLRTTTHQHVYIAIADDTILRITASTKLTVRVKVNGKSRNVTSSTSSSVDYSDYGKPVSITLPNRCKG